jgi:phage-related protein
MAARAGAITSEVAASHSLYESQPEVVADLIVKAAKAEPALASTT